MYYQQKIYLKYSLLITIFLLFLPFQIKAKNLEMQDFVVAKVNNKIITDSEIQARIRYVIKSTKIRIADEVEKEMLRGQIIDKMIEEELIRQEAQKLNVIVLDDEMRNALEITALQRKKNIAQFKFFLQENNFAFNYFSKYLEAEILWSKIIADNFSNKIKVTDLEIEEFLEQGKSRTDARKFLLAEIVIGKNLTQNNSANNALEFSQKIFYDLSRGADFKELVHQFSASINAQNNGEIGWVSQGDIDPKIYQAINNLPKNSYAKPILLDDGYHIFKVLDVRVEKVFNKKEADLARNFIFRNKLRNYAKGYLMDMRKKAFIEIVE
jgi:peptidyl-prolyl cis-trans isomerase SurA